MHGVDKIDGHTDGDRFTMADCEFGELLQLVGHPVTEIERAGRSVFEGVTASGDVIRVVFGTAANHEFELAGFQST